MKIQEDDVLYFFYKKYFEHMEKEYETPKNLCPYFWTAVFGFILCLWKKTPLILVWGFSGAYIFLLHNILLNLEINDDSWMASLWFGIPCASFIVLSFIFCVCSPFWITGERIKGKLKAIWDGAWATIIVSMIIFIIGFLFHQVYVDFTGWEDFFWEIGKGALFLLLALASCVAFLFVTVVVVLIFSKFSTTGLAKNLYHVLISFKNGVCPLVEIDPEIEEKAKIKKEKPKEEPKVEEIEDKEIEETDNPYQSPE
jgi:hypothetical protein